MLNSAVKSDNLTRIGHPTLPHILKNKHRSFYPTRTLRITENSKSMCKVWTDCLVNNLCTLLLSHFFLSSFYIFISIPFKVLRLFVAERSFWWRDFSWKLLSFNFPLIHRPCNGKCTCFKCVIHPSSPFIRVGLARQIWVPICPTYRHVLCECVKVSVNQA